MIAYKGCVGVLGATSIVGEYLLPLLVEEGWDVSAFSRQVRYVKQPLENYPITWQLLTPLQKAPSSRWGLNAFCQSRDVAFWKGASGSCRRSSTETKLPNNNIVHQTGKQITFWISLAPITALPEYFPMLLASGVRHIVALSSTSRFTKDTSSDPAEKKLAENLAENEDHLAAWATKEKITFTILRTTLVYGLGRDKNVSVIAAFIRRFSCFSLFGDAQGLRQPVHAQDVASACVAALDASAAINRCYNISGGEIVNYREMVCRIFSALGRKPRFVTFPLWLFRLGIFILRIIPPFQHWSVAMAERMNQDLIFNHEDACRDLNFSPRNFKLDSKDLLQN